MNVHLSSWYQGQPEWFKSGTSATVALITVSAVHSHIRQALVLNRLHTGWCPRRCFTAAAADSLRKEPRHFIEREAEAQALQRLFLHGEKTLPFFFYFLTGPAGGGKTTLVQSVCHKLRAGIIYVPAGSDPGQFGHLLGGALQLVEQLPNPVFLVYDYVLHIAGGVEAERTSKLTSSLAALEDAARHFRMTRRRPPVLVIDNAERLCASGAVFGEVLFAAQQWADRGLVRVIFVSSDDAVVTCLLGHTRCSKAGSLEMGDLSAAQATNFLQRQGVADKDAARVVDVAGGRLLHLLAAVDVLHRGGSAEDVRRHALAAAEADYQNAGLLDNTPQAAAGLRLARALLAQEAPGNACSGIDSEAWNRLVPDPRDKDALLGSNVFAKRYMGLGAGVVFESRCAEVYARERLGLT